VACVAACIDPFEPPPGTYAFDPPHAYVEAWQRVEQCSGLRGEFRRIHWFDVPGSVIPWGAETVNGLWHAPHDIYLSDSSAHDSASGYFTARHEMLHDLLNGGGDHPPVFARCGLLRG